MKNEELRLELINLANTRSTLPHTESTHPPAVANEPSAELERARAMARHLSAQKGTVRTSLPCHQLLGEQGSNTHLLLSVTKTSLKM